MKTPKLSLKQKNRHLNILIAASFKVNSGGNLKMNKRRRWRQRSKIKAWLQDRNDESGINQVRGQVK